jgi:poly(3-hydroxybutyrate) depolymerase
MVNKLRLKNYVYRIILGLVVAASMSQALNTECEIHELAIANDLAGEEASAPKICFPNTNGVERCFYLLVPDCAADTDNVQLIIDLHDKGSCPLNQSRISGWKEFALSDCFLVAWPLGITDESVADDPCFTVPGGIEVLNGNGLSLGTAPDCCCTKEGKYIAASTTDDLSFLRKLLTSAIHEAAMRNVAVNTTSIEFTGLGNGATAALGFTALNSDIVACVSSFSGTLVTPLPENYNPVPVFTVLDTMRVNEDQELAADVTTPVGSEPYLLPSPSRTDGFFSTANGCTGGTSKSNQAVDEVTGVAGIVAAGRFEVCEAPVNFLKPPFAAYKTRTATDAWPVNRVVDTTALAMFFCKDKQSPNSANSLEDVGVTSSANSSARGKDFLPIIMASISSFLAITTSF